METVPNPGFPALLGHPGIVLLVVHQNRIKEFGHQISLHLGTPFPVTRTGKVGDHLVMMPHLGVVLPLDAWLALAERLAQAGIAFDIPPVIRFAGEPGEQRTMFFFDPSGNPIEVKGFKDFDSVFAR